MRTDQALFDESAAALQFPGYFGENRDAFDECLSDLPDWLITFVGYVLVITEAQHVLDAAPDDPDSLAWFISSLSYAHHYVTQPGDEAGGLDEPIPLAFHVVLPADASEVPAVRERWQAAGAVISVVKPPHP